MVGPVWGMNSPVDAQVPQSAPPPTPTGLTGTFTHESVSLSWDDPGDPSITGYQILRRERGVHEVGHFLVHVDATSSTATSYADTAVEAGASYVYRVKARNSSGLSERSGFFRADIPAAPDPPAPIASLPEPPDTDRTSDSGPRSSHVATLSALVVAPVASGAPPVALSPAFRPAKLKYTAALESDSIIVTATATDGAASVVLTDGETTGTDEATTFDLGLGVTTVLVTVTSADGTSSAAYEITITRTMSISFVAAEYEVTEGESVSVEWEFSGKPREYLHVPLVSTNKGNATGDDWDMTLRLTIAPLSEGIRFRFQALQDTADDDGEQIVLGFGELPAYVTVGDIDQTVVSIIDDDGLAPSERPLIVGTAQVGETLTVDTSGITNPNGVSDDYFVYYWRTMRYNDDLNEVTDTPLDGCRDLPVSWYHLNLADKRRSVSSYSIRTTLAMSTRCVAHGPAKSRGRHRRPVQAVRVLR